MFFTFLFIILISCSIILYLKWRKVKSYWSVRNVPFLKNPHPFYGSFTFLRSKNPEKMYNQLLEAQENNSDELDVGSEIVYVDCVIKETIRLFPTLGWVDRIALEDYKIDDKLTIEAGTPLFINGIGMHMDPKYFPEPNSFVPDRFLPENESKLKPYAFGEGPRSCKAQRFAMIILRNAIVQIITNYKIENSHNAPKTFDLQIEKDAVLLFTREKLKVKFIPRK